MKIEGNKITLDVGEEITIKCQAAPQPQPEPEPQPTSERLSFQELLYQFNEVLAESGKNQMTPDMEVTQYLDWVVMYAGREFDNPSSKFFDKAYYPDILDRFGDDDRMSDIAYNAMVSWLMAMHLARIVPNSNGYVNTQTKLFLRAYEIGKGSEFPLFGGYTLRADAYATREAAARIYAYTSGCEMTEERWSQFREELGGQMIPASCWSDLGYTNTELTDDEGRRGYATLTIGYIVNAFKFLPDTPEPRVPGTTATELNTPQEQGQAESQFNANGNYIEDERVYNEMVKSWNMMAQTPLSEWNSYSIEKQNRLVNVMATPSCTYNYMFGKPKPVRLVLDNGNLPVVDDYPRYVFEKCESSDLVIDGPFSDLAGIYRYNVEGSENEREQAIQTILDIADNFRFPIQDPNYGRCRPGCSPARTGKERNPIHGAAENELYNISISALVADTEAQKQKILSEDGFAADSPRSYVSGHSTQIVTMALLLSTMNPEKVHEYSKRAYDYSENRAIGRFHWQSDCIYGRLIATMALPIIQAMEGLQSGFKAIKDYIDNPQPEPVPETDCTINIVINNTGNRTLSLNGELCLVLANPDKQGTYYGWEGPYNRTSHIRFNAPLDIEPNSSVGFYGISMENEGIKVRGRNLVEESVIPDTGKPSNVMLYDVNGVAETYIPLPSDSDLIFDDGVTLVVNVR